MIIDCENQTSARTFCDSLPEGVTIHLISSRVHSDPTVYAPEMDRVVVWHEVPHDRAVERVLMAQARVKEDVDFMAVVSKFSEFPVKCDSNLSRILQ